MNTPALLAGLLLICVAVPEPALAHPPYEHTDRVFIDNAGRSLYLKKSYTDGIFFTDPVKLVVRDGNDRTVAETEYGRDISVICWRSRTCVVFRYGGLVPVVPENIWRLDGGGQLRPSRSPGLIALGVVAPLWTHAGGYLLSFTLLGAPFLVLWLVSRSLRPAVRAALIAVASVGTAIYLALWLYAVVLLSYLSLPLVIVACLIGGAALFLARRAVLRAGVADSAVLKVTRASAMVVAALGGAACIAVVWLAGSMISYSASITFDEPAVHDPLAKASVTRVRGVANEVFATIADGVKLEHVVNLHLFDGFDANMTVDEAARRLGPPSGRWTDPAFKVQADYYDRPDGRVSILRRGACCWSTVGHPSACTHDYVFLDARLRDQILQWLPPKESIQVHVLRDVGWGGLTIQLTPSACTSLVLTARDGDSARR